MNSTAKLFKILPIFLFVFWSCQPEEESILDIDVDQLEIENFLIDAEEVFLDPSANGRTMEEMNICSSPMDIPLYINRNKEIGNVSISNTSEYLLVNYKTISGYTLRQTKLVILVEKKSNTFKRKNVKKYKKYVLPIQQERGTSEYTYQVPLSQFKIDIECIRITAIAKVVNIFNKGRKSEKFAKAKLETGNTSGKSWLIDYCVEKCAENLCETNCSIGFGIASSSSIKKSRTFNELGITDWPWGYAHEINNPQQSDVILLPIKIGEIDGDPDSGIIVGNANVIIEGELIYVSIMMNEDYPISKSSIYLSDDAPVSGNPCDYNYVKEYTNADGTANAVKNDLIELNDTDGKFWIVVYTDVCSSTM